MSILNWLNQRSWIVLIIFCALPFAFSAAWNQGFMASDEYWTGITRYIPAQNSSVMTLLKEDDVKAPTQLLPMHIVAQTALAAGVTHPFFQYVLVVFVLGLLSTVVVFGAFLKFFEEREDEGKLALVLLALYFASPMILTRPMFESLSAPWLAWAALFAVRYDRDQRLSDLLWGAAAGAVAFALRPQTGICCLIFPLLALVHRQWRQFAAIAIWGVVLLVITGLPDLWIRGGFHHSLKALINYNVTYGGDYGHQPWWYYLPLLFLLAFGPWLFMSYGTLFWRDFYLRFRAVLWMIVLFVFEHSLFTHKFERFLIPLIPLIIMMLVPFVLIFLRNNRMWRLSSLAVFNLILWLPTTFSEPQGHLIQLVRYLDAHPEIHEVLNHNEALTWVPDVFRTGGVTGTKEIAAETPVAQIPCDSWMIAKEPAALEIQAQDSRWKIEKIFKSGIIEIIAYKLNPQHNLRRAPLALIRCSSL